MSVLRLMRSLCWITKATTHTLRVCNKFWIFTATVVTRGHLDIAMHVVSYHVNLSLTTLHWPGYTLTVAPLSDTTKWKLFNEMAVADI
jgi:hypothetical protein